MLRQVFILSLCFLLVSCGSTEKREQAKQEKDAKAWPGKMQGLADNVKNLVPYIYNKKNYSDPANATTVKKTLTDFSSSMHSIKPEMGKKYLGPDPILDYSLEQMRADVDRASDAFSAGQVEYSRSVMKSVVNHCFRCHSLTDEGSRAKWDISTFQNLSLTPIEKADLMVAARDYEGAKNYLEALFSSSDFAQNYQFEFEGALRRYLAIMLRIKKDPKTVLEEINKIQEKGNVPPYVQEQIKGWRKSLEAWAKEPKRPLKTSLFTLARLRVVKGQAMQAYPKDHAGDVEFLRATSLMHDFLSETRKIAPEQLANAYLMLGTAYEVLDDLGYWNLHEYYYESCIKTAPKSKLADSCYKKLEASVYLGYSGSSGVHVPEHEKARLQQLKNTMK